MNKGKVGRPYQYSNAEIFAAYAIICNKMYTFSKTKEMKEKELMLKALVYNTIA